MSRHQLSNEHAPVSASIASHEGRAEYERVARNMAYFDRHGATFEAVPGWPGWYCARWKDEAGFGSHACRWACCIDAEDHNDWRYALAFKARVEAGARS